MKTLILIVGVGLLFSTSVMSASAETSPLAVTERVESNIDCVEEYHVEQWNAAWRGAPSTGAKQKGG